MCVLNRTTCHRTFWNSVVKGSQSLNKKLNSIVNKEWVQIATSSLLGCEALGMTLNFSEPQFPLL